MMRMRMSRPEAREVKHEAPKQPERVQETPKREITREEINRELRRRLEGRATFPQERGPRDNSEYNSEAFNKLTKRDTEIIHFIADNIAVPIDVLAKRFFQINPTTGRPVKNPEAAAQRKLDDLAKKNILVSGQYASTASFEPGGKVYLARIHVCTKLGIKLREIAESKMIHHLQTLRTVERLRDRLKLNGDDIATVELERGLDGNYKGHIPDAKVTTKSGKTIAVEYVSIHYDDKLIEDKANTFKAFDEVIWSGNSPTTASKVERITKANCISLPRKR